METFKIKIKCGGAEKILQAPLGSSLYTLMRDDGIYSDNPCGGRGVCGKCRVRLTAPDGSALAVSEADKRFFSPEELKEGNRLACTYTIAGPVDVSVRTENYSINTTLVGLAGIAAKGSGIGVAVDIGTTTVAAYLVELSSGRILSAVSRTNAQRAYGADVISRIQYTTETEDGLERLHKVISSQLNQMVAALVSAAGLKKSDISRTVATGNTVMQHLLAGVKVASMGVAPYTPSFTKSLVLNPNEIGLDFGEVLYVTPSVSAFVGGDITCGLFACERIAKKGASYLLLDLGTNGELALVTPERTWASATAAGPAFEGGCIECGCGAIDGAVNAVKLTDGKITATTIGGKQAVGICGSGLIDAVAALLAAGKLASTGRLYADRVTIKDSVYLSQKDIREVQLAKAAIRAGVETLLKESGVSAKTLSAVYLSGGFGSFLNADSALSIGLLPESFRGIIKPLGNTAASGAVAALLGEDVRHRLETLAAKAVGFELSSRADFNEIYADSMMLGDD